MAGIWFDPGGSATGGIEFLSSVSSSARVTAQTGISGAPTPYVYQFDTGPTPSTADGRRNATIAAAGRRISCWFMVPALPPNNTSVEIVGIVPSASITNTLGVYLGSDGILRLYTSTTTTLLKTGSTALSANTWYRVDMSFTITTTSNWGCKVYIGKAGDSPAYSGTLEMTATNADGTLSSATPDAVIFRLTTGAGTNYLMYVTNIAIDDTSDQSDYGAVRVTAKLPTTNTTNGFDTTIGTGAVNERPVSTTNGKHQAATADVDQDYDIETAATGDADLTGATLVESMGWIWAELSSLTGTPLSKIIVNGARIGTSWDPAAANTAQLFTTIIGSGSAYPRHASNGKNIGTSSSTIAADTKLWDCGVVIAYIPAAAATKAPPPFQRPWRRPQRRIIV